MRVCKVDFLGFSYSYGFWPGSVFRECGLVRGAARIFRWPFAI